MGITNGKFSYDSMTSILQRNMTVFNQERNMTAAIQQTNFFAVAIAAIRSFSQDLYIAHGGYAPSVRG